MENIVLVCYPDKLYRSFCHEDCNKNNEAVVDTDKPDRFVFYCDLGMTKQMDKKIMKIKKNARYDIRWLPDDSWNRYISELKQRYPDVPERTMKI